MAATITATTAPQTPDTTGREAIYDGIITLTDDYGTSTSHGDTLDLTPLFPLSSRLPTKVEIWEQPPAGTAITGWLYGFGLGTTQANGVLIVYGGTGAGSGDVLTEYPEASAYSSGLLAAVIRVRAWFPAY